MLVPKRKSPPTEAGIFTALRTAVERGWLNGKPEQGRWETETIPLDTPKRMPNWKPPFIYFGGKAPVAGVVWAGLGNVRNYVEPFFGSGAVLFLRPGGAGAIETANDTDALLSNFWRALKADPDAVADAADWPVNEADLHARHLWLVGQRARLTEKLMGDPNFHDAKAAGWWVWGINCWIGSGWCSGAGPWVAKDGVLVRESGTDYGIKRELPHLGSTGQGVNRQRPHLGSTGQGECEARRSWLRSYLKVLADRLRDIRICCGNWDRVLGPSVTWKHGLTGVFLDPPYSSSAGRGDNIYAKDCMDIAYRVRDWALANGDNPLLRIILAGYAGEYRFPPGWRAYTWGTSGGYALEGSKDSQGRKNKDKEILWFSPHCIPIPKEYLKCDTA